MISESVTLAGFVGDFVDDPETIGLWKGLRGRHTSGARQQGHNAYLRGTRPMGVLRDTIPTMPLDETNVSRPICYPGNIGDSTSLVHN